MGDIQAELPEIFDGKTEGRLTTRLSDGAYEFDHVWDTRSIRAVNAALAANRPLLVRGDPGTGKTQLALAAAEQLGWTPIYKAVDSQMEAHELLWQEDAVSRLAQSQLVGALKGEEAKAERAKLDVCHFIEPGPLWWAFDYKSALGQFKVRYGEFPKNGNASPKGKAFEQNAHRVPDEPKPGKSVVVAIDEIDKAELHVANGLLEALGSGKFTPPGCECVRSCEARAKERRAAESGASPRFAAPPPLVVLTTNEERALPDALVRRCVVLELRLPEEKREFVARLSADAGRAHFPEMPESVRDAAARVLWECRQVTKERDITKPGQAEYVDLLRAVDRVARRRLAEAAAVPAEKRADETQATETQTSEVAVMMAALHELAEFFGIKDATESESQAALAKKAVKSREAFGAGEA